MNFRRLAMVFALLLGIGGKLCTAQEIMVAAAADLQFVMQDVAVRFQKEMGKNVIFNTEDRTDEDGSDRQFSCSVQCPHPCPDHFVPNQGRPKPALRSCYLSPLQTLPLRSSSLSTIWVRARYQAQPADCKSLTRPYQLVVCLEVFKFF